MATTRRKTRSTKCEPTVEDGERALRAAYYTRVRDIAKELLREFKGDDEAAFDAAHERVDADEYVIYTHKNLIVLLVSDNWDAYVEENGTDGVLKDDSINYAGLAFAAMHADVMELLNNEHFRRE